MIERSTAHVLSRVLGADPAAAAALAALARSRGGRLDLVARLVALLVAASRPGRLLPRRVRERAAGALLDRAFRGPGELMLYAGLVGDLRDLPCGGLRPE